MEVSMRAKSFCEFYGQISFQKNLKKRLRKCNTFNSHFDNWKVFTIWSLHHLVNFWFHHFLSVSTLKTHTHTHRLHWSQGKFSRSTRFTLNTLFQISRRNKISRDQNSSQFKVIRETTILCKYYFWVTGENTNGTNYTCSRCVCWSICFFCYANQRMLGFDV